MALLLNVGDVVSCSLSSTTPTPDSPIEPEFVGDLVSIELDEPLRAVGDYKDTLDLGTKTYTKRIQELVLTGEENWTFYGRGFYTNKNFNNDYLISPTDVMTMSNYYMGKGGVGGVYDLDSGDVYEIAFSNNSDRRLFIKHGMLADIPSFKSYLAEQYAAGTPVVVWYVLAEPIVTTLSSIPDGLTGVIEGTVTQSGTPTPDNPIEPVFNGTLLPNGKYQIYKTYKIPISSGGVTKTIYLGQTPTTRKIKKLVLTGKETIQAYSSTTRYVINIPVSVAPVSGSKIGLCTHYFYNSAIYTTNGSFIIDLEPIYWYRKIPITDNRFTTADDFKSYLAAQYAAGTPVTVWYVLAEPETAVVNEPLCKIGDYADSVNFSQAGIEIPTLKKPNTTVINVETEVEPSEVDITYRGSIKPQYDLFLAKNGDSFEAQDGQSLYIGGNV